MKKGCPPDTPFCKKLTALFARKSVTYWPDVYTRRGRARTVVGHVVAVSRVHVVAADGTPPLPAGIRRGRLPRSCRNIHWCSRAGRDRRRTHRRSCRRNSRGRAVPRACRRPYCGPGGRRGTCNDPAADRRRCERVPESQAVLHHGRRPGHRLPVGRVIVLVVEEQDDDIRPGGERRCFRRDSDRLARCARGSGMPREGPDSFDRDSPPELGPPPRNGRYSVVRHASRSSAPWRGASPRFATGR